MQLLGKDLFLRAIALRGMYESPPFSLKQLSGVRHKRALMANFKKYFILIISVSGKSDLAKYSTPPHPIQKDSHQK
jgi:hypothetical protein